MSTHIFVLVTIAHTFSETIFFFLSSTYNYQNQTHNAKHPVYILQSETQYSELY